MSKLARTTCAPISAALSDPDVVHALHFPTPLPAPHPLVVTLHDLIWIDFPFAHGSALNGLGAWLKARTAIVSSLRRADHVITVSRATADAGRRWLDAGARVPADVRLIESAALRVDESALTGESVPVDKDAQSTCDRDAVLADRRNMAFAGTSVTGGRALGLVVATGRGTQLGTIARLVEQAGEVRTPLQERLARFGRRLALAVIVICAVIFAAGLARGEPVARSSERSPR